MENFANVSGPGAESKTIDDWIDLGNKQYRDKNYDESIKSYFFGMMKDPLNIRLLTNRSASYMKLGYYWLALNDTENVLSKEPGNEKAIYRQAMALFGLGRCQDGIDFLNSTKKKTKDVKKLKLYDSLIANGKKYLLQEQHGDPHYDVVEMIKGKWTHLIRGEYTGPLKIGKVNGKGLGLLATADIKAGQLVLAHRAFAVYFGERFYDKDDEKENDVEEDKDKKQVEDDDKKNDTKNSKDSDVKEDFEAIDKKRRDKLAKLVSKVVMTMEAEDGRDLAQLHAAGVPVRFPAGDGSPEEVTDHDVERIEAIVKHNAFCGDQDDIFTSDKHICGLWSLPSYLNHSCVDCNCKWNIYGDFLMVRAFRPISKGEELLISYVAPETEFSQRSKVFENLGFTCTCTLCELDRGDSEAVQIKRKELLEAVEFQIKKPSSERMPEELSSLISQLTALRAAHPKENVYLVKPLAKMAEWYFELDKWKRAAQIFERVYDIVKGSVFCMNSVQFILLNIIATYVQLGDHDRAHEWAAVLKKDTQLVYGEGIEWASELYEFFSASSILGSVEWIKGNLIKI